MNEKLELKENNYKEITDIFREAATKASKVINDIYSTNFETELKSDNTPITKADIESNKIILKILRKQFPSIPIISEEEKYNKNRVYNEFILIDPLDGTKEFINKNGEFTVNIALIQNKIPKLGVVQLPTSGIQYFSDGTESFKINKNKKKKLIIKQTKNFTIACSKSHLDNQILRFLDLIGNKHKILRKGSSLKFCLVAESKASIYIRFGKTMEWDIAAGHSILRTSGGHVKNLNYKSNEIKYGKKNLQNSAFIAHGKIDDLEKIIILAKQV